MVDSLRFFTGWCRGAGTQRRRQRRKGLLIHHKEEAPSVKCQMQPSSAARQKRLKLIIQTMWIRLDCTTLIGPSGPSAAIHRYKVMAWTRVVSRRERNSHRKRAYIDANPIVYLHSCTSLIVDRYSVLCVDEHTSDHCTDCGNRSSAIWSCQQCWSIRCVYVDANPASVQIIQTDKRLSFDLTARIAPTIRQRQGLDQSTYYGTRYYVDDWASAICRTYLSYEFWRLLGPSALVTYSVVSWDQN